MGTVATSPVGTPAPRHRAGPGRPAARGPARRFEHVSETTSRGCTHLTRHEDPIYRITTVCTRVRVLCRARVRRTDGGGGGAHAAGPRAGVRARWAKLGARCRHLSHSLWRHLPRAAGSRRAAEGALSVAAPGGWLAGPTRSLTRARSHSAWRSRTSHTLARSLSHSLSVFGRPVWRASLSQAARPYSRGVRLVGGRSGRVGVRCSLSPQKDLTILAGRPTRSLKHTTARVSI